MKVIGSWIGTILALLVIYTLFIRINNGKMSNDDGEMMVAFFYVGIVAGIFILLTNPFSKERRDQ